MAKGPHRHFVEAQILQSLGSTTSTSPRCSPRDYTHHIDKWKFTVPFVCGATNLGEALRRITEGAAMIRSKGEAAPATSPTPPPTCAPSAGRSADCRRCRRTSCSSRPRTCRLPTTSS